MRIPNKHYCHLMHEALVEEQSAIAREFQSASVEKKNWLREQLAASDRAFKRLREREQREREEKERAAEKVTAALLVG